MRLHGYAHGKNAAREKSGHPTAVPCLLYTSDAADDLLCVDLGGRRIIKKKKEEKSGRGEKKDSAELKRMQYRQAGTTT